MFKRANGLKPQKNHNNGQLKPFSMGRNITGVLKKASEISMTMRIRLFTFLIALVVAMVLGVIIILLATGSITVGKGEAERNIQEEFSALHQNLTARLGDTSVQLALLSESLSKSIETRLQDENIQVSGLQSHPEILEEIVGNELSRLQLALEKTKCSGVFMILDATVNPALPNKENSRAGLCLRNIEPELSGPDMMRRFVRGFPDIAYKNGLFMVSNWDMEFDVTDRSFYHLPISECNETELPASRLIYWGLESVLNENGDSTILCCIPLIDSNSKAFGVCGFEISALNFQSFCTPDDSEYSRIACMLSLMDEKGLNTDNAIFSGYNKGLSDKSSNGILALSPGNGLNVYVRENGEEFLGLHEEVKLYPSDSAFAENRFALSLILPKDDLYAVTLQNNIKFVSICAALLLLGVAFSFFISKKYLSPIMSAFDTIHSDDPEVAFKTNILEINSLLEQIKALREKSGPLPDDLFEDFIERVGTLTPTETEIFRYYLEGKSGKEILATMYISANTLKVHNKHIYTKLNVSSKDELLLYIELIKKSGLKII